MGSNDETIRTDISQSALDVKSGISLCNGRYKLLKVLGKGGFGITYLGLHTGLNKKVAIKEYFPKDSFRRQSDGTQVSYSNTGENRKNIERFLKEARTMAELKHKGVVSVSDVFEENATAYYVMDYIEGQSLENKGILSEAVALKYINQIARALKYIHDKGILHLDIKPANIMIDQEDNAVLIDFGISKHYDGGGEATSTTTVGYSAGYSPIEQMTPGGLKQFTPSTDIYALGATIYKIISGTKPPASTDLADDATLTKPDGMSQALFRTVSKCMEQKRKDRPQTMDEVIALLNKEPNPPAPSPNPPSLSPSQKPDPKSRKVFFVIIGLVIVIGVSALVIGKCSVGSGNSIETATETAVEYPEMEISSNTEVSSFAEEPTRKMMERKTEERKKAEAERQARLEAERRKTEQQKQERQRAEQEAKRKKDNEEAFKTYKGRGDFYYKDYFKNTNDTEAKRKAKENYGKALQYKEDATVRRKYNAL